MRAVVSVCTEELPMACPVPLIGRDGVLRRAHAELRERSECGRGQFGGWPYESCNPGCSCMQGRQAADTEFCGTSEEVLW